MNVLRHFRMTAGAGLVAIVAFALGFSCSAARADELVYACSTNGNAIFASRTSPGLVAFNECGSGGAPGLQLGTDNFSSATQGATAAWQTTAPPGLEIAGAAVPSMWV